MVVAATGAAEYQMTPIALDPSLPRPPEADAVLVVPPPRSSSPRRKALYATLWRSRPSLELPLLIYNIPGRTGVSVSADPVERIAEQTKISSAEARLV